MTSEVKQKCFVIMPFSKTSDKHTEEYWTNHYNTFIKPLIELHHPLIAGRSSPLRGDILRQIITDLVTAKIVVADLTDANPNVYWELGVRQSFKHCTVTIAEDGTNLPFDLGGKGTLFYFPSNHIKLQDFQNKFHQAIDDCLTNSSLPDSHVLETINGRGTLHQILMRDDSIRRLDALISEIERNASNLQKTVDTCNANIQKDKESSGKKVKESREFVTRRFSSVAVEMLVVSRYIDADKTFYQVAERYMDNLITLNDQLLVWEINPLTFESWLLNVHAAMKSRTDQFKKLVIDQKNAIEAIL
jgi:hypothetical protein